MTTSGKMKTAVNFTNNRLTYCIICLQESLIKVIDLGFHPLADTFLKKEHIFGAQKLYSLHCLLCTKCGHLQNAYLVPPTERYIENEYSYTSSNSKISRAHWQEFAQQVSSYVNLRSGDHVIEFGSNDGFLLQQFLKKGAFVSGIDPSGEVAKIARKKGVYTFQGFIGSESLEVCRKRHGKARLIIGNNVLNHIHELNSVIAEIRKSLQDDGYFICEFPYLKDLLNNYIFDLIYHEHISYFSIRAVDHLLKRNKLYITHIEHNNYHGGSVRIFSSKHTSQHATQLVKKYIDAEQKDQLFSESSYQKFMQKITQDKYETLKQIYSLKKKGKKIAAVGAGARGNTLINFYKLDNAVIDFVTDNSKYKIGKYTPFSTVPIVGDTALATNNIDVALILSWNIGKYLVEKIKKINPRLHCIVPGEKKLL